MFLMIHRIHRWKKKFKHVKWLSHDILVVYNSLNYSINKSKHKNEITNHSDLAWVIDKFFYSALLNLKFCNLSFFQLQQIRKLYYFMKCRLYIPAIT